MGAGAFVGWAGGWQPPAAMATDTVALTWMSVMVEPLCGRGRLPLALLQTGHHFIRSHVSRKARTCPSWGGP